jgi:2-polyprenyl-3-methyl-5-hydroxy-6-metoxy-1,4-benzoquinol methylase
MGPKSYLCLRKKWDFEMPTGLSNGIDILNGAGYRPHIIFHLVIYKFVRGFVKPTDEILDIACGTRLLSDYYRNITGVDISADAVYYASKNYGGGNRKFSQGNILEIKGQYDIIVSYETIEHINKEEGFLALKRLKSCLKPHGILFISTQKNYLRRNYLKAGLNLINLNIAMKIL